MSNPIIRLGVEVELTYTRRGIGKKQWSDVDAAKLVIESYNESRGANQPSMLAEWHNHPNEVLTRSWVAILDSSVQTSGQFESELSRSIFSISL